MNLGNYFGHVAAPCLGFSQALSPSISICLASLPLGDVASMESLELPALRDRGIAEVLRGQWAVKDG